MSTCSYLLSLGLQTTIIVVGIPRLQDVHDDLAYISASNTIVWLLNRHIVHLLLKIKIIFLKNIFEKLKCTTLKCCASSLPASFFLSSTTKEQKNKKEINHSHNNCEGSYAVPYQPRQSNQLRLHAIRFIMQPSGPATPPWRHQPKRATFYTDQRRRRHSSRAFQTYINFKTDRHFYSCRVVGCSCVPILSATVVSTLRPCTHESSSFYSMGSPDWRYFLLISLHGKGCPTFGGMDGWVYGKGGVLCNSRHHRRNERGTCSPLVPLRIAVLIWPDPSFFFENISPGSGTVKVEGKTKSVSDDK